MKIGSKVKVRDNFEGWGVGKVGKLVAKVKSNHVSGVKRTRYLEYIVQFPSWEWGFYRKHELKKSA